ncbi:MAG TPA: hypothetical protein VGK80_03375 [Rhodanobacteraceae bacterium]
MTALTIAAVALAAGWAFVRGWLQTRYMVLKETGHPQYFAAGVAAVCLFTLGACVHHFTHETFNSYSQWEREFIALIPLLEQPSTWQSDQTPNIFAGAECAGWALILAALLSWLYNVPAKANRVLQTAILKREGAYDAIDGIYAHSLEYEIPLAFTLKSAKVYIGFLSGPAAPEPERKWVELFPLLSGYRDDRSRLITATNYMRTYEDIAAQNPNEYLDIIDQFKIVLPLSEVLSIQAFNVEKYAVWFKAEQLQQSAGPEMGSAHLKTSTPTVVSAQVEMRTPAAVSATVEMRTPSTVSTPTEVSTVEQVPSPGLASTPEAASRPAGEGQFQSEDTANRWSPNTDIELLYPDELFCLRAYFGYITLFALGIGLLAFNICASMVALLFAGLFAVASCDDSPPEDWL